jgi:hypothetical protein
MRRAKGCTGVTSSDVSLITHSTAEREFDQTGGPATRADDRALARRRCAARTMSTRRPAAEMASMVLAGIR